jgi:hypothetical protein
MGIGVDNDKIHYYLQLTVLVAQGSMFKSSKWGQNTNKREPRYFEPLNLEQGALRLVL